MHRKLEDGFLLSLIYLAAFFSVILLVSIIAYIFVKGLPRIDWDFLTTASSALKGTTGIAGNLVNTLYIVLLTMLIVIPIGIGSAIYLNEYAKRGRTVRIIEFATEILSGIPSIIFGMFGMAFFGNTLGLGYSILTGALTLALMVLPLVTRNTQEALRTVPDSYRNGAVAMGAAKWYMIRTILLPSAMPGILTGILLAIGRIVGESAALLFTAGSGYLLPKADSGILKKIMESGGTLTVQMYLSISKAQYDAAFGIAAVLLVLVAALNLFAKGVAWRLDATSQRR